MNMGHPLAAAALLGGLALAASSAGGQELHNNALQAGSATSKSNMAMLFAFWGFLTLFVAMMLAIVSQRYRKIVTAAREWEQVPAVILSSKVGVSTEMRERGGYGGEFTWYTPMVEYAYAYAGADHQGQQIRLGDTRTQIKKEAEEIATNYPEGAQVMAYVNPHKPGDATLKLHLPRYKPYQYLAIGCGLIGGVLILASAVMFLL